MKFTPLGKLFFALMPFCLFLIAVSPSNAQSKDWLPIAPAEMSAKTSVVEPNADAEALFWEVRVDDSSQSELALRHYVRIKVFTEKGRDDFSKRDIVYLKGTKVKDVEAKVTKPDGSVSYLAKTDVLEREIVKANGFKVRAKSFALPGLEPGSIIEYRYKEVIEDAEANMRLIFQRDIPIRTISYYVRPFNGTRSMYYMSFNMPQVKFEKDQKDYFRATMNNVPAFREEPYSLPEDEVKSWMFIYYASRLFNEPTIYWSLLSNGSYKASEKIFKANKEVKAATEKLLIGATTEDERLKRIHEFVRSKIRNISNEQNVSDEDWKRVRKGKSAGDTLELGMGTASDVNQLFAAMASAAGFDVRTAFGGDRNEKFINPKTPNFSLMISSTFIAVKSGTGWKYFNPASSTYPYGELSWTAEGERVLISDPDKLIWEWIPLTAAERSLTSRKGNFKLLDDGTLEGEATFEYTGHSSSYRKAVNIGDTDSEKETTLKDLIKRTISGNAEIISYSIENADNPDKNFVYKFKIKVPNYAVRTGRRLFFQPEVFEALSKPVFTAADRKTDIYISYPSKEVDDITIELPNGFELENADSPSNAKDADGVFNYQVRIGKTVDNKTIFYHREFSFGNGGNIRFGPETYPTIKSIFESINKSDLHQLTLRQSTGTAATSKP